MHKVQTRQATGRRRL